MGPSGRVTAASGRNRVLAYRSCGSTPRSLPAGKYVTPHGDLASATPDLAADWRVAGGHVARNTSVHVTSTFVPGTKDGLAHISICKRGVRDVTS